jgi:pyrroloquinoline quinone biosynthesis protein E
MQARAAELPAAEWARVFSEAAQLGVLHLHLTGGEPVSRQDLIELVSAGRAAGLYVNLITSGLGLNEDRLKALIAAGLDHVQLSFQDCEEEPANEFAGTRAHARKLELAKMIAKQPVGFTLNMVVHRGNLGRLKAMITMAEEFGVDRIEIANVQYYGWALANRDRLMPTRRQMEECVALVAAEQQRLKGKLRIDFVPPDYYARYPKACMGGWGNGLLLVDPAGRVLPCHAAGVIPGLTFDNVQQRPLAWIWEESPAFLRFRGEEWMKDPCRSCDRRAQDFGGCRCQAMLLTGDAAAADPVCTLAPGRKVVDAILAAVNSSEDPVRDWVYRIDPV